MLPQEILKKAVLKSILVCFWPCITCIKINYISIRSYIYYIYENLGGAKGYQGGENAPLRPPPPPPPPPQMQPWYT